MRQLSGWNLLIENRLHGLGNSMDVPPIVRQSSLPYVWLLVKRPNPTQAPNKVGPFIPALKRAGLSGPFTVTSYIFSLETVHPLEILYCYLLLMGRSSVF